MQEQQPIDAAKVAEVLKAMRAHAEGWAETLAGYQGEDGEVSEEYNAQVGYCQAKDDAGWSLLDDLGGWIEALSEALTPV